MNRIEELRKENNLSQRKLCDRLGISVKTLYNYVSKDIIPSDVLIKLSRIFNCSTDYIVGIINYKTIAVTDKNGGVICVLQGDKIIEHTDCKVYFNG